MELIDKVYLIELMDEYGELLTTKQQLILENYCNYDLAISEIGTEMGLTRQAVFDSLQKSIKQLQLYEETLKVLSGKKETIEFINKQNINQETKQQLIEKIKGI